jgi:hypothetical protein
VAQNRKTGPYIAWTTMTYRSVMLMVLLVCAILITASYIVFPQPTKNAAATVADFSMSMLEKTGLFTPAKKSGPEGPQQAHFTAIDGSVRVKKANSNTWINADYATPLEKGDVVQTGSEGMAKVVFADGTNYTVKQDSLIVVEENSSNAQQQTSVSVQVTTGTVDLTTATYMQGSRSQVIVAGALATFAPESAAQVRNDPRSDSHEILVKKGAGEVSRGSETVRLSDYEKVSFKNDSKMMAKEKELGPPILISPANMAPIFTTGKGSPVQFAWTPIDNSVSYRLRVSRNPYFSSTVLDSKLKDPQFTAPLVEGAYYWMVQSLDGAGKESVESERNRFTVIPRSADAAPMVLDLDQFVQHGHVIEVRGKTEPNARVMVNGQEVPMLQPDGSFQFLTAPLPTGENLITITAQNTKGGVRTEQKKIIIQ